MKKKKKMNKTQVPLYTSQWEIFSAKMSAQNPNHTILSVMSLLKITSNDSPKMVQI